MVVAPGTHAYEQRLVNLDARVLAGVETASDFYYNVASALEEGTMWTEVMFDDPLGVRSFAINHQFFVVQNSDLLVTFLLMDKERDLFARQDAYNFQLFNPDDHSGGVINGYNVQYMQHVKGVQVSFNIRAPELARAAGHQTPWSNDTFLERVPEYTFNVRLSWTRKSGGSATQPQSESSAKFPISIRVVESQEEYDRRFPMLKAVAQEAVVGVLRALFPTALFTARRIVDIPGRIIALRRQQTLFRR